MLQENPRLIHAMPLLSTLELCPCRAYTKLSSAMSSCEGDDVGEVFALRWPRAKMLDMLGLVLSLFERWLESGEVFFSGDADIEGRAVTTGSVLGFADDQERPSLDRLSLRLRTLGLGDGSRFFDGGVWSVFFGGV